MINILYLHSTTVDAAAIMDFCSKVRDAEVNIRVSTDVSHVTKLIDEEHFDIIAFDLDSISIEDATYYYDVWHTNIPLLLVASDTEFFVEWSHRLPTNAYSSTKDPIELVETLLIIHGLPELLANIDIVATAIESKLSPSKD